MNRSLSSRASIRGLQGGVVLIITLIVLVAMTLAGIALLRSVDIATLIAGNLAFRQSGTIGADVGAGAARQWLMTTSNANAATLDADVAPMYFSSWDGGAVGIFDPTTFNWGANSSATTVDAAGNSVTFVIHRMCEHPGDPTKATTNCITGPAFASGCSQVVQLTQPCEGTSNPYYRITARSVGPRNTVTYTQTTLY